MEANVVWQVDLPSQVIRVQTQQQAETHTRLLGFYLKTRVLSSA